MEVGQTLEPEHLLRPMPPTLSELCAKGLVLAERQERCGDLLCGARFDYHPGLTADNQFRRRAYVGGDYWLCARHGLEDHGRHSLRARDGRHEEDVESLDQMVDSGTRVDDREDVAQAAP